MNEFRLVVELGNDAMQDGRDVAQLMVNLARHISLNDFKRVDGGKVRDLNGNTVGQWEVS